MCVLHERRESKVSQLKKCVMAGKGLTHAGVFARRGYPARNAAVDTAPTRLVEVENGRRSFVSIRSCPPCSVGLTQATNR